MTGCHRRLTRARVGTHTQSASYKQLTRYGHLYGRLSAPPWDYNIKSNTPEVTTMVTQGATHSTSTLTIPTTEQSLFTMRIYQQNKTVTQRNSHTQ